MSDCISKLLGNTPAGDPSPLGNKEYSDNDSMRIPFLVMRRVRLIPSSTRSVKLRTIASKAMCITSGVYKTSCLRFSSSNKALAFSRSPRYMFGPVGRSGKSVMLIHGCVRQVDTGGRFSAGFLFITGNPKLIQLGCVARNKIVQHECPRTRGGTIIQTPV